MTPQTYVQMIGCAFMGLGALVGPVYAQDAPGPHIAIELNSMLQNEDACRLIFMAENSLDTDVDALVFETVLFTKTGVVERLTLFDFQDVPEGSQRVRQFELGGLSCDDLGRVLFNGTQTCSGANVSTEACRKDLTFSTLTDVEVLG